MRLRASLLAIPLVGLACACGRPDSAARSTEARDSVAPPPAVAADSATPGQPAPLDGSDPDRAAAVDVIRAYYAALARHDPGAAYALWSDGGRASGQTYETFASGYAATDTVWVETGAPGPMGAAAGSRYVEVPVVIRARTTSGEPQRFEGVYVLRRSVVDGATAEQRSWRIYSAEIRSAEIRPAR